jgi:hypothetical protein
MRRLFLTLTLLSFPGWSQSAQQPAQPPIVVKVEMPPTNPWVHLVELVVPGIIGAGLALLGVWLTNKNNAATNAANREHQFQLEIAKDKIAAEAKSRDNRWEFRKDVYVSLIKDTTDSIRFYANISRMNPDARVGELDHFRTITDSFMTHMCHARLAMANEAFVALEKATKDLLTPPDPSLSDEALRKKIDAYFDLRNLLSIAGRNQLWGSPEPKAKAEAAT